MEYSEALQQVVEDHIAKHGPSSLWSTPGVYEALAEDPAWHNAAVELMAQGDDSEEDDSDVPEDWPVQPIDPADPAKDRVTCGQCGRSWDDGVVTSMTPAPSARCPFEAFH
jgi:hypothetical protein